LFEGKSVALDWVDEHKKTLVEVHQRIWELAEVGLQETRTAKLLTDILGKEGFRVERGVARGAAIRWAPCRRPDSALMRAEWAASSANATGPGDTPPDRAIGEPRGRRLERSRPTPPEPCWMRAARRNVW